MGDAQIECPAHHSAAVLEQVVAAKIMPQAQGNSRQQQAAPAGSVVFHIVIAFRIGDIHV
ncbi:hypothetical protein D3C74_491450 [compost metagenome]